jgi:DtxR family Mn-dependent transcriptional regulator
MEDYLEAIGRLSEAGNIARVTKLSRELGVSKPSVSAALNKLAKAGLVQHERYGSIELTAEGRRVADDVIRRHEIMRRFLTEILGIDRERAEEDACRMEHVLSPASLERFSKFVEFLTSCPQSEPAWHKGFSYYLEYGEHDPNVVGAGNWEER